MKQVALGTAALGILLVAAGAAAPTSQSLQPLLGANFIRDQERPPNCGGRPLIVYYQEPGFRDRVRAELAAMRAAGLRTLRLFIYHANNVRDNDFLVPSAGGRLVEPYRTNLTNYLDDVRAAGFTSMTVTFNPWFENDPIGYTQVQYDPSTFGENWAFIADIRPLVKEHGPETTRIDLINEGAPDYWQPQLRGYVAELWRRYADAFGTDDALVSIIVKSDEGGGIARLQNLIAALRETGRGLPSVFQVHPSWTQPATLVDLQAVDAVLKRQQLSQPLVIGEEAYNAVGPATAIAQFLRESSRPVLEVMEWPLETGGTRWSRCPTAPYRVDAYMSAFGRRPFRLTARVGANGPTLSSAGVPVRALGAGRYTIAVIDASARDGFRLAVGDRKLRTGVRFRGTAGWRVRLREYDSIRYGSARFGRRATVDVLGNGYSSY